MPVTGPEHHNVYLIDRADVVYLTLCSGKWLRFPNAVAFVVFRCTHM